MDEHEAPDDAPDSDAPDSGETADIRLLCATSPDDAVRVAIDRLRRRRVAIADALGGRSLRVGLTFDKPTPAYHITFTRDGHVMTRSGPDFHPHLEIHGAPTEVGRFLAGDTTVMQASFGGLVTLHVSTAEAAEYRHLRALVAEELRATEPAGGVTAGPGGS